MNYFFDNSLKMQNDLWGIRNIEEVTDEAKKNGFLQEDIISCLLYTSPSPRDS